MTASFVNEPPSSQPRPPWYRRHVRRIAVAFVAAGVILLIGQWVVLPWLLHDRVAAALAEAGVQNARFRVARATLWGSQLANVTVGDGSVLKIDRVALDYKLSDLWHGRLKAIRIAGANLRLAARDGGIDLGQLKSIVRPSAGPVKTTPTTLPAGRIEIAASKLLLQTPHETVEVPLGGSIEQQSDGRISVSVQLDQERALVIGGTLEDSKVNFAGAADPGRTLLIVRPIWPDAKIAVDGELKLSGALSWGGHPLAGEAQVEIVPAPTSPTVAAGAAVSGDKLRLTSGVFHVSADLSSDRPLRLRVSNAALALKDQDFTAEGVNGEIAFAGLSPLKTAPDQKLTAARMKIGEMELTDGTLEFAMTGPDTIHLKHTEWTWLGGRVWADDVDIVPGKPVTLTVRALDVDLKDLLATFAQSKASGEGKLSGEIPVIISGGSNVQFGNGKVTGLRGGTVQIKDAQTLQTTAEAAAQSASGQVKKNIIEALSDFQYDTLTAELEKAPSDLIGHVHMRGRGRSGAKQPLNYELNITGLEDALKLYLGVRQALSMPTTRAAATRGATRKVEVK